MKTLLTSLLVFSFIVCSIKGTALRHRVCNDFWPNEAEATQYYNTNVAPLKVLLSWDHSDAKDWMNSHWVTKFYYSPYCVF